MAIGKVTLIVCDVIGREVASLMNGKQNAGSPTVNFDASKLPSGAYFYRLTAATYSAIKKMIIVK